MACEFCEAGKKLDKGVHYEISIHGVKVVLGKCVEGKPDTVVGERLPTTEVATADYQLYRKPKSWEDEDKGFGC